MEKKEFFEKIESVLPTIKLIPFNWEFANYDVSNVIDMSMNDNEYPWDEFKGFSTYVDNHLLRAMTFMDPIPEDIKSMILSKYNPAFIVPMGEDSMIQSIGYPKTSGMPIYTAPDRRGCPLSLEVFDDDCIFVGQCGPCANQSLGLIPIKKYKLAQFLSLSREICLDDSGDSILSYKYVDLKIAYATEVLGLKLINDEDGE